MFNKYNNNVKKTWQLIDNIITLKNNSKHNTPQNNRPNSKSKFEKLNVFFSNVGKTISAKISKAPVTYKHFLNQINFKDSIFLPPTDANEINNIIRQLKMKQNCQSYDIPSNFLKLANTVFAKWLAELLNRCNNEGVITDSLKIACITPISKIRNPQSLSDCRPISVLPTLSKVFEKLLYQRVYSFLTQNNAIAKRQYGFRTNHSTD